MEKSSSRYFSEDTFKKLKGDNKELMIIPMPYIRIYMTGQTLFHLISWRNFQRILKIEGL